MVVTTTEVVKRETPRLLITTRAGTLFDIEEKDGALVIQTPRTMFMQWDGQQRCEVRQLKCAVKRQEGLTPQGSVRRCQRRTHKSNQVSVKGNPSVNIASW